MPEIGATLHEARMRQRIDISEIETATKIRAKYLRALENEEWDQLPGPTFVKTFLRTYAEALGLDAKLLVEEYKLRHERVADAELRPISPRKVQQNRGRAGGGDPGDRRARRDILIAVLIVLIVGIVIIAGATKGDGKKNPKPSSTPTSPAGTPVSTGTRTTKRKAATAPRKKARSSVVRLEIIPTGEVNVCLKALGGMTLVDGVTLTPADVHKTFRSKRFTLTLGNNAVKLKINGVTRTVPAGPVSYAITAKDGRRTLPASQAPQCSA